MKTSTTIIFVLVLFSFSEAQIKHDRTFEIPTDKIATALYSVSQDAGVVNFETLGTKLYFFDLSTWKMHLYNLDYSLLKTIDIQFQLNRSYFHDALIDKLQIMGLSQHLFDADDGVEFLVYIYSVSNVWPLKMNNVKVRNTLNPSPMIDAFGPYDVEPYDKSRGRKSGNAYYAVVDDNGEVILALSGERISSPAKISNAPNGAKMFLPVSSYQIEVYSLPGKLPDQSATLTGSSENHGDNLTTNNELVDLLEADLKAGDKITLHNVQFVQSSYEIREDAFAELQKLKMVLQENPNMVIQLDGHTDNQGNSRKNLKLSVNRVEAIKDYLVNKGIDKNRIKTKGYGATRPVASNAKEETRKLNRRVEIRILRN